jgi:hypothetical protein
VNGTAVAPTEQARKNHDELIPGHVSTLAVTDPELIGYFDNFAFDEVLRYGTLDPRTDSSSSSVRSSPAKPSAITGSCSARR